MFCFPGPVKKITKSRANRLGLVFICIVLAGMGFIGSRDSRRDNEALQIKIDSINSAVAEMPTKDDFKKIMQSDFGANNPQPLNRKDLFPNINNQSIYSKSIEQVIPITINTNSEKIAITFQNKSRQTIKSPVIVLFEINGCTIAGDGWYVEPDDSGHVAHFKIIENVPPDMNVAPPKFKLQCDRLLYKNGAVTFLADNIVKARYRFLLKNTP